MIDTPFAINGRINVVVEHAFVGLDKYIQAFFDASTAEAGTMEDLRSNISSHAYRLKIALPEALTQVSTFDLSRAAEAEFGRAGMAFARIYNAALKVEDEAGNVEDFLQAVSHLRRTMRDAGNLYVYNQGGADERDIALGRTAKVAA